MDNIVVPDPLGEWDHCKNNPAACTEPQLKTIQGGSSWTFKHPNDVAMSYL